MPFQVYFNVILKFSGVWITRNVHVWAVIQELDSESEGSEGCSNEDAPSNKDVESDDSSNCGDLDWSESGILMKSLKKRLTLGSKTRLADVFSSAPLLLCTWNSRQISTVKQIRQSICRRPHIMREHNIFMEDFDLQDACVGWYNYHMRSRGWYGYLFLQTIILVLVSTWLIDHHNFKTLGVYESLKHRNFWAAAKTSRFLILYSGGAITQHHISTTISQETSCWRSRWCAYRVAHWPVEYDKCGCCKLWPFSPWYFFF